MDRLAVLRDFVARSPDDPFPRYGLAMELAARGQLEEARQAFQELVDRAPGYVPAYLMYGNLLARMGDKARAREIYRAGAEVSARAGDSKAESENLAALAELEGAE
ncbi:MAG TPA: tetratricopeptide repeat protein [Kofleriaceae bacterium]|nr:tetratricopeptide repeat protein [Kofleriaceae bacterium]